MSPLVGKIVIDTWMLVVHRSFYMHGLGNLFNLKKNSVTSTIISFTYLQADCKFLTSIIITIFVNNQHLLRSCSVYGTAVYEEPKILNQTQCLI